MVDVTTFHNYDVIRGMATEVLNLKSLGRPVICTEYMSRGTGSTFDPILGYLRFASPLHKPASPAPVIVHPAVAQVPRRVGVQLGIRCGAQPN